MAKKRRPRRPHKRRPQWTPEMVDRIVCNPVYAGMGPYPQVVDDALWIDAARSFIREHGTERFLQTMLTELRESVSILNFDDNVAQTRAYWVDPPNPPSEE